ncbi:MAG: ribonuclease H-like domain-containing protein [Planctomycetes bacterium]|nr:ribonuclease H-like domain-containing protein [Planctomycetota bacterium]
MNQDERSEQVLPAENLAALTVADHRWDVFAQLRNCKELTTKQGRPYLIVELADVHATIEARIWDNAEEAMAAAKELDKGATVKIRGKMKPDHTGKPQLSIERLKAIDEAAPPEDYDPDQLIDPALRPVEDLCCRTLVFDIETVPAFDRKQLPTSVGEALTGFAARQHTEPDLIEAEARKFMGLSPFFGKVVSIAIGDGDAEPGSGDDEVTVLAVPPDGFEIEDCPPWLRLMSEADMLRAFWALCSRAEVVVSFNGRGFDIPFVVTRSLIHGVPARVDLASQRFALRPHLDLLEILTQRGRGPSKLDVVCWALGIESPKGAMDGSMVAPAYARGEIVKIAEYNAHDVRATSAVYRKVRDMVLRYRADWVDPRR